MTPSAMLPAIEAEALFFEACECLFDDPDGHSALSLFQSLHTDYPHDPRFASYFGVCLARSRGWYEEAEELCRRAVDAAPPRVEMLYNLGQVCMMRGDNGAAYRAFRRGFSTDHDHSGVQKALERLGLRRRPVFKFLPRSHVANVMAGKMLTRVGVRKPLKTNWSPPVR